MYNYFCSLYKNAKKLLVVGSVCFMLTPTLFSSTFVYATSQDDINSQISILKGDLSSINSNLVKINDKITDTIKEIESHRNDVNTYEDKLARLKKKQAKQYKHMKKRIKYMYERGNTALFSVLGSSSSLADFLNKAEYISSISSYDRKKMQELVTTSKKIAKEKELIQKEEANLASLKENLVSKQKSLQDEAGKTSGDIGALSQKLDELRIAETNKIIEDNANDNATENTPNNNVQPSAPSPTPSPANPSSGMVNVGFVPGPNALTKQKGVVYYNGHRETYYSELVLPGTGLRIPGRHVGDYNTVRDINNYLCVASNDYPRGTVVETSLGLGKVYDCGCASGTIDIYVHW